MELANIEKLLERYLNAETTIQEENQLRMYFKGENIPPHLEQYISLFNYLQESKDESYSKTIHLDTTKRKNVRWKLLSIAAMLVLFVSVYSFINNKQELEARQALAQTQEALQLI